MVEEAREIMRALSLTQPWATAVALELKRWETRSWPTNLRGEIAIHAAKGFPKWAKEFAQEEHDANPCVPCPEDMPLGCIVAVAEITDCQRTEKMAPALTPAEIHWGDYAEGRYCFRIEKVRPLSKPVPARGALGFWAVDWDLWKDIRDALKATQEGVSR